MSSDPTIETVTSSKNSYDEVPYPRWTGLITHPNRLACMATLFGLQPAEVATCRVLELACASGGNLIPMAYGLPQASFVGVDLSSVQLTAGKAVVESLGLTNIRLEHANILDLPDDFGTFDYIIAHGVYSWVPPAVQDKILSIYSHLLAPQGVGYISYNCYPGWHSLEMVRELMLYHVSEMQTVEQKVQQARAVLKFVMQSTAEQHRGHSQTLREHWELFSNCSDSYLYHELLEENNQPVYFHQFAARAAQHNLKFLSEASLLEMRGPGISEELYETLQQHDDPLIVEQYVDFLVNRTFRKTLLCHANLTTAKQPLLENVPKFRILGMAVPKSSTPDLVGTKSEEFTSSWGSSVTTSHPVDKTSLFTLAEAVPFSLTFADLLERIQQRLYPKQAFPSDSRDHDRLCQSLLNCYLSGMIEFELFEPVLAAEISPLPVCSPVARMELADSGSLTNMRHQGIAMQNPITMHLIPLLDGKHDHEWLVEFLVEAALKGSLDVEQNGKKLEDVPTLRRIMQNQLEYALRSLYQNSLLVP